MFTQQLLLNLSEQDPEKRQKKKKRNWRISTALSFHTHTHQTKEPVVLTLPPALVTQGLNDNQA